MGVEVYYTKEVAAYNFALTARSDHLADIHYLLGANNCVAPTYTQAYYFDTEEEKVNGLH